LTGLVNAGVIGLIFGTFFLLYKRNLWPLVLAHGFINSLGFTSEFMGWGKDSKQSCACHQRLVIVGYEGSSGFLV